MKTLDELQIGHLHYLAPLSNAASILVRGILSYNRAKLLPHCDASNWGVQRLRGQLIVPNTSRSLHDFVPLFFATHTPMQYVLTQGYFASMKQHDLVVFEISASKAFAKRGRVFSDGNAAACGTKFYRKLRDLHCLDWNIIRTYNAYSPKYKRIKSAELLVPDRVPPEMIISVRTIDFSVCKLLRRQVREWCKRHQLICPELRYFNVTADTTHFY